MYDIFYIGNHNLKERFPTAKRVNSFEHAKQQSLTKMFWVVWPDIKIKEDFDFSYKADDYSLNVTHVFLNGSYYDGICLFPKNIKLHSKELEYRFFSNKKEVDIIASYPHKYEIKKYQSYNEYLDILKNTTSEFVYFLPKDLEVNYNFDYQAPYWEKDIIHVFKNGSYYDGIFLNHKNKICSKRELEYRFFSNKKEVDIIASTPSRYDIITVSTYEEYIEKLSKTKSEFVYVIPSDVTVKYNFEYAVPYKEKDLIHIFKNKLYNDGVFIQHKSKTISKREFEFCWYTNKKELDIVVSEPKPYDIVFISYNEPNADTNYKALQQRFPRAKRIHGVKGIHNAHKAAAKLCDTDMLWIVDGDAQIVDDFEFDYQVPKWQRDQVFVWHSQNPINNLVYGYGGVKLFPRKETLAMDTNSTDMTTSISPKFNVVDRVSNVTAFNTGEFETWKSAFRECAKLASKTINRQNEDETDARLETWTTVGSDRKFGEFSISGACAGREYGHACRNNPDALRLINDFNWLEKRFKEA